MNKTEISQAVTKVFTPSIQQQAFFTWIVDGKGSCLLIAVAGAGKTTTLIEALKLMMGNIFFGAYNTKISAEIFEKVKVLNNPKLRVSTFHSAGFSAWRFFAGKDVKVDDNKCRDIFREMYVEGMAECELEDAVLRLVSYAKQAAMGCKNGTESKRGAWMNLIDHFSIDTLDQDAKVIEIAAKILGASTRKDSKVIDFDDMIFAPLYHDCRMFQNDWVLVDEAQDTNIARRLLAMKMLKRGGRLVAVGDPHQAIYGFTGADADALHLIGKAVNAIELPLTVTYRCPKAVVQYAQQWVNHIEAHPSAPEGEVTNAHREPGEPPFVLTDEVKPNDAILCRFNAPLVENVYQFIAKGIAAKIEGREIGEGLKQLAKRWKVKSFEALLANLDKYEQREVEKFMKKEQESRAEGVKDKVKCLKVLIGRVNQKEGNPIKLICDEIDTLFGDDVSKQPVVTLTSIHKSKGREWHNVYWLQAGSSPWARQDWELQQEVNLNYVAATRAKSKLVLVPYSRKK